MWDFASMTVGNPCEVNFQHGNCPVVNTETVALPRGKSTMKTPSFIQIGARYLAYPQVIDRKQFADAGAIDKIKDRFAATAMTTLYPLTKI
jgi:hypothetical protein